LAVTKPDAPFPMELVPFPSCGYTEAENYPEAENSSTHLLVTQKVTFLTYSLGVFLER
jgi:hypothetical protein